VKSPALIKLGGLMNEEGASKEETIAKVRDSVGAKKNGAAAAAAAPKPPASKFEAAPDPGALPPSLLQCWQHSHRGPAAARTFFLWWLCCESGMPV
jgi:hypothetical protein